MTNNRPKKAVILHSKLKERTTIMRKLLIMATIFMSFTMVGCNVTRVITNESQYVQKGDTSILIQTKTIETYEASKKGL